MERTKAFEEEGLQPWLESPSYMALLSLIFSMLCALSQSQACERAMVSTNKISNVCVVVSGSIIMCDTQSIEWTEAHLGGRFAISELLFMASVLTFP
jgi:hypothetical protein